MKPLVIGDKEYQAVLASVVWSVGFEQRRMCAYGRHTSERKILLPTDAIKKATRIEL